MSAFWFHCAMVLTKVGVRRETERRLIRLDLRLAEDIQRLRGDAGVSRAELADIVGVHRSHLDRIEAGRARPSIDLLVAIGVALGADTSVRYFAGAGPRLHDRFQAPMVEGLIRVLDLRWRVRLEVQVTQPSRGVIDLVLTDPSGSIIIAVEVQSELRRLEQQIRWANEKADGLTGKIVRDGPTDAQAVVSRLLVLRSTLATREVARRFEATLATAYPARTADLLAALTSPSAPWPGSGIVWMTLDADQATLLPGPPRGVRLGR